MEEETSVVRNETVGSVDVHCPPVSEDTIARGIAAGNATPSATFELVSSSVEVRIRSEEASVVEADDLDYENAVDRNKVHEDFGTFTSSIDIVRADYVAAETSVLQSTPIDESDFVLGETNNLSPTNEIAFTENMEEFDTTNSVSIPITVVNPDILINSEKFDGFGSAPDALALSLDLLNEVDNDEVKPTADLSVAQGDVGDVAFSDSAEPAKLAAFVEKQIDSDTSVGELAQEPVSALSISQTQPKNDALVSSPAVSVLQNDHFGASRNAEPRAMTGSVVLLVNNDDDDIGAAEPLTAISNLKSHVDDDDFGDFDGAATAEFDPENVESVKDDDDFGDFDEAPIAASNYRTDNPFDAVRDPLLERLYFAFPKLFPPTNNGETSIVHGSGLDLPLPLFTESDSVSIQSCLGSFEASESATSSNGFKSYNPAYILSALFSHSGNESKLSRYIVSNNLTVSPFCCRIEEGVLRSIPKKNTRARAAASSSGEVERITFDSIKNHPVEEMSVVESLNRMKFRSEPSGAAKAFLDRIPDLSYMLSSEFSPPDVVSTIK